MRPIPCLSTLLLIGLGLGGPARARAAIDETPCFDALVIASAVRQTPMRVPDCGPDCIPMRWPWVLTLDVEKVLRGKAPLGPATVQSVQHTYVFADHGGAPWRLRRNKAGGFNALSYGTATPEVLCREDAIPADPFVKPRQNQTLNDLVAEGERLNGRGPKECCLANSWTGRLKLWIRDKRRTGF